ncbi:hypothetical protein MSG28_003950 [Choristoneura fumiferana]|uniref:Uncharacterized protein n=1 Tax=Choristoneura fumiferana TaxID=7141 RepID=A0ACC0KGR9_CHOFU|nr:hypothetical protein MSG28_003950 [Choristoneura fumiferana]
MSICRTCLKTPANKDISGLENDINEDNKNYLDIMLFCLDIKVNHNSNVTTNLCLSCYKKIISFYKFKELSLKNDAYLKSINPIKEDKEDILLDDTEIKNENCSVSDADNIENFAIEVKKEIEVKDEDALAELQSDDELLSVIKKAKYGSITNETKENVPIPKIYARSKKKKLKYENDKNNGRQVCEECGKSVRNLKDHAVQHQPKSERRKLPCKVCPKVFTNYSARSRHYKIKHLGLKKKCDICDKEVVSLRQHKLVVHEAAQLPYGCVPCGRRFISQSALELHMTTHTKDRAHECDVCQKKFRARMHLLLHKRQVHEKEKSHMCQFCSKTFFKKYHLQVHLRSHTKEKPYSCQRCGKCFSSSSTLRNHRTIHSDVKQFSCQLCDMAFARSNYLKNHMISHTRERRHPCQYCGLRFGRSDHRKRHEWTAHQKHYVASAT